MENEAPWTIEHVSDVKIFANAEDDYGEKPVSVVISQRGGDPLNWWLVLDDGRRLRLSLPVGGRACKSWLRSGWPA